MQFQQEKDLESLLDDLRGQRVKLRIREQKDKEKVHQLLVENGCIVYEENQVFNIPYQILDEHVSMSILQLLALQKDIKFYPVDYFLNNSFQEIGQSANINVLKYFTCFSQQPISQTNQENFRKIRSQNLQTDQEIKTKKKFVLLFSQEQTQINIEQFQKKFQDDLELITTNPLTECDGYIVQGKNYNRMDWVSLILVFHESVFQSRLLIDENWMSMCLHNEELVDTKKHEFFFQWPDGYFTPTTFRVHELEAGHEYVELLAYEIFETAMQQLGFRLIKDQLIPVEILYYKWKIPTQNMNSFNKGCQKYAKSVSIRSFLVPIFKRVFLRKSQFL